jgi:predicted DNA-binding mobile mystery protein A
MKTNRKNLNNQRQLLDHKLIPYLSLREALPKDGWLKAIRTALGLTAAQLVKKIGTQASGVLHFEKREVSKTATLASLDRAAQAMDCRLGWAIVPSGTGSLSVIVENAPEPLAARLVKTVDQTVRLEAQGLSPEASKESGRTVPGADPRRRPADLGTLRRCSGRAPCRLTLARTMKAADQGTLSCY